MVEPSKVTWVTVMNSRVEFPNLEINHAVNAYYTSFKMGELPACFFPPEVERTYDRSIRRFISLYK
jgi:hypothetical protein